MSGFAIIDLETTGFAYTHTDRVCEIGVVLIDSNGHREGAYTTLVNPQRDLSAQHIHHIDATDARIAPTFDQIIGDLTSLLRSRTIVSHNAVFHVAFLLAEYERAGYPLTWDWKHTVCSMRWSQTFWDLDNYTLASCAAAVGHKHGAHTAAAHADAVAAIMAQILSHGPAQVGFDAWLAHGELLRWPDLPVEHTATVARGSTAPGSALLERVVGTFTRVTNIAGANEYLDLLDRVLLDRKISTNERRALDDLAADLGLDHATIARLNRQYMLDSITTACADDKLTPEERATIIQLAGMLALNDLEVEALLSEAESKVAIVDSGLALKAGDLIVLTGFSEAHKAELRALAEARGLVVWAHVKKSVVAVVALDEGSNSGKARKARAYGIPVVGEGVLG